MPNGPIDQTGEPDDDDEAEDPTTPEEAVIMSDAANFTEVYRTGNDFVANLIISEILGPAGITAYGHDRRSHALPAPASMPGEIGIAVPETQAERARQLLREARTDGVIMEDGDLIEGPAIA
jgi:hypothetical protein